MKHNKSIENFFVFKFKRNNNNIPYKQSPEKK